ncbi:MAG: hypothetical protein ACK5PF_10260, partial [bacterium]
ASAEDGTASFTADFSATAGNCLVIVAGAIKSDTSETSLATAVSGGGTWSTPDNVLTGSEYQPNAFVALCPNCSSGAPTINISLDTSSSNQVTGVLQEWSGVPTSSVEILANPVTGTNSGGTSTQVTDTGTLSTTQGVAIFGCFGWGGIFSTPSGFTGAESPLPQQNGVDGYLGGHVAYRNLTSGDASGFVGSFPHQTSAGTAGIMVLLRDNVTTPTIRVLLDPAKFTSADTGITAFVYVNGWPDTVLAYRITGLVGDATAGRLDITPSATNFPPNLRTGDTVRVMLSNGTDTSGLLPATLV